MKIIIYAPKIYIGPLMSLCENKKGNLLDLNYMQSMRSGDQQKENVIISYEMPYSSLLENLTYDIKSVSSGFASIDYEITNYREADLVNLEILINDVAIDVLSETVYRDEVYNIGRGKVEKLKAILPRMQFRQIIQAKVDGKIIARSEISPFRKDVLKGMSGGDRTRKDKLLKKQKKGKVRMQQVGRIEIPQKALFSFISS